MSIELLAYLISLYFGLQVQGTVRLNKKSLGILHVSSGDKLSKKIGKLEC